MKTMTLNLTEKEMAVLEALSTQKDLSKTVIMRQALRLYQLVDDRLAKGHRLFIEDRQKKAEIILLCCSEPAPHEPVFCSCGRPKPGEDVCSYCHSPVSPKTKVCSYCEGKGVGFDGRPCQSCNK